MSGGTRTLTAHVWVHDEAGVPHGYGPGESPPAWAAKAITNDAVWSAQAEPAAAEPVTAPRPRKS